MSIHVRKSPYRHSFGKIPILNATDLTRVLIELKGELPWNRVKKNFYDQYELSLKDIGSDTLPWNNKYFKQAIKHMLETSLDVALEPFFTATAHLLGQGQYINPHTDAPGPGYESIRVGLVINDGEVDGGEIQILDGPNIITDTISFNKNNFFLLDLSQNSWHAVTPITRGKRYSVIFSFWEQTPEHYLNQKCLEDMLSRDMIPLDDGFFLDSLHKLLILKVHLIRHTQRNLLTHLVNTYRILLSLDAPAHVCRAGLWHSIYSQPLEARPNRTEIAAIIGSKAEKLVYFYSMGLWNITFERMDEKSIRNYLLLDYANFIDQLEYEAETEYIANKINFYKPYKNILAPKMEYSLQRIFGV